MRLVPTRVASRLIPGRVVPASRLVPTVLPVEVRVVVELRRSVPIADLRSVFIADLRSEYDPFLREVEKLL